jgi:ATP-binding cassette, subfamily B, bacterial MsbA
MISFLLKVWGLAKPYRGRLLLGVAAGIVAGLIEPLMIATITSVYSLVFPSANAPELSERLNWAPAFVQDWAKVAQEALATGFQSHPIAAIVLVGAIPTVIFLRGFFSYLNIYFLQWAAIRAITDLRVRLFSHLLNLSASFFSRSSSGELISRTLSDTHALHGIISNATAVIVKDPVTLAALLAGLLWQQPRLTLISMVVLPLCLVPIVIYGRKVRRSSSALQLQGAKLTEVMSEAFTGNRIIKAYNLEGAVVKQFRDTARQLISHYMRIVRSSEAPGPLLEFFGAIGVALVFLFLMSQTGGRPGSAGFLMVILSIFAMYRPLKNLARLQNNLQQARAASQRVFELLATENSVPEPANPQPLRAAGADIHFDQLEFAYGDKTVLQGINLTVQAGQLVALVGASGSGKTTLTNLLLRFYDPQKGAVRIGDTDIRHVSTRDLRSQLAVVTQETILFNDTIRNNIALGRPGANNGEIEEAAQHAFAHEFILEKPQGYDTVAGEKGVTLSGGQRQRIAIARAILRNAPILILDEAMSALDTESERAIQAALEDLMRGRTTICIAHRLSTVQKADLIVVLNQGRIVDTGKHAELIKRGGIYQKLYELQFQA